MTVIDLLREIRILGVDPGTGVTVDGDPDVEVSILAATGSLNFGHVSDNIAYHEDER